MEGRYLDRVVKELLSETELDNWGSVHKLPFYSLNPPYTYNITINEIQEDSLFWGEIKGLFGLSNLESIGVFLSWVKHIEERRERETV